MKCPKCGFNSFEFYDSCKKCSSDLVGYKQTYSITSTVLPLEAKEKLAAEFRSAESASDMISGTTESHDDIFSFDLPDDSPSTPVHHNADPFNFNEQSTELKQASSFKSEKDVFADLLESTSQVEESAFAGVKTAVSSVFAAERANDASSGPGEFDLESFSWDDTPAADAPDSTEAADDFDSFFGDTKENISK